MAGLPERGCARRRGGAGSTCGRLRRGRGDGRLNGLQFLYQALDLLDDGQLEISKGKYALVHVPLLSVGLEQGRERVGSDITTFSQTAPWNGHSPFISGLARLGESEHLHSKHSVMLPSGFQVPPIRTGGKPGPDPFLFLPLDLSACSQGWVSCPSSSSWKSVRCLAGHSGH